MKFNNNPYSKDKIAEDRALEWAVFSGACFDCKCLVECAVERDFVFPEKAACMKKKAEYLSKETRERTKKEDV